MAKYGLSELVVVHIDLGAEDAGWDELSNRCPNLSRWGVKILRSGLDGYVRSVVIEPGYVCKDYRNTYSHYYSKKFLLRPATCYRLHFFSKEELVLSDVLMDPEDNEDAYLGYSVIHPIMNRVSGKCLGRTVIDPLKCGHNPSQFYCLRASHCVSLQGTEYTVSGYPYICQDGEAMVCAHAALWTVCRYLSTQYPIYRELYPYDLIEMTGDTLGRRVPNRGMLYTDYSTIFTKFGCHPVLRRPDDGCNWMDDKETFLDIYAYLESGFPILMSFYRHVAAVIGHTTRPTLAFDAPDENGYHDSYALLDQYIVVDDNFFPYQKLGSRGDDVDRNYGKQFEGQLDPYPSKEDIFSAVIPLPEKAFVEPGTARTNGRVFLGLNRIKQALNDTRTELGVDPAEPIITRLFLTTTNSFKKRKREQFQGIGAAGTNLLNQFPLRVNLPHFVWVMEVSPLELYKNQFVLGEVIMDASAGPHEMAPIYSRIGNHLYFDGEFDRHVDSAKSFRQYTHNLGER